MSLIYLIRHASTRQEPSRPAPEWGLSDDGVVAAAALAGKPFWTTIQQVITSRELKTYATVAPALELWELPHTAWAEFDEVQREGYTSQMEYEARVARLFAHPDSSEDGWETAANALARGMAGLERVLATYPAQNLALVGHGLLWALVRTQLLGRQSVDTAEWKAVQFPDLSVWRVEQGLWQLLQDFEGIRRL